MADLTDAAEQIANQLAELHGHWYGHGPSNAKAYIADKVVVVLLEETFTNAEKSLIARDEAQGVREMRRRFQNVMAQEFSSIVEQATGQDVRSFVSDTDLQENLSIEVFVLGEGLQDMSAFEQ